MLWRCLCPEFGACPRIWLAKGDRGWCGLGPCRPWPQSATRAQLRWMRGQEGVPLQGISTFW